MGGLVNWVKKYFNWWKGFETAVWLDPLEALIRGLTGSFSDQDAAGAQAWTVYYTDNTYYVQQLVKFVTATRNAHGYTLHVRIPGIISWAGTGFARLLAAIIGLARALARDVAMLTGLLASRITALTTWILRKVWAPLWAFITATYRDLLKWGWVAWWWITHLASLAEAMIFFIARAMEKYAWELAGMLGRFVVSLIVRNARKIAEVAESIVVAVF